MKIFLQISLFCSICVLFLYIGATPSYAACGVFSFGSDCNNTIPYCDDGKCSISGGVDAVKNGVTGLETTKTASQFIQDIVKYLLSFISIIGVLFIIYAGFQLMIGAGDEEKAKKAKNIVLYVALGLILMWMAYAIVAFVIKIIDSSSTKGSGSGFFQLIPETHAYTENDTGTFDEYRRKLQSSREQMEIDLRVDGKVSSNTFATARSLILEAYNSLPDNPDASSQNDSLKRGMDLYMQLAEKNPGSTTHVANLVSSINTFTQTAKIDRISGSIEASPVQGNAPLTVTFRAVNVIDPSGVIPSRDSFIWWTRGNGGVRRELGRGPTFTYTFSEEQTYTVFLDIVSGSRNKKGRIDVLPFSASKQIEVKPRIGNITLFINGVNVSDLSTFKISPSIAKAGLILDATASRGSNGTVIQKTKWTFGNENEINYAGAPQVERQIYANEGKYTISLELENNQGQKFKKDIVIVIKDPASVIQLEKDKGFIGETFRFSALSYFSNSKNIVYRWEILDAADNKRVHSADGISTNYAFSKVGRYTVSLFAKSPNGKEDVDSREITIESKDPVINLEIGNKNAETPNTFEFDASRSYDADTSSNNGLSYSWRVDGSVINLENVSKNGARGTYTFDTLGEHVINLTIANSYGKVATMEKKVNVDSLLSVAIDIDRYVARIGDVITLMAISPNASFFEWTISDGSPAILGSDKSIQHTFKKSGSYSVTLTVRSNDGKQSNQITRKLYATDSLTPYAFIQVKEGSNFVEEVAGVCDGKDAYVSNRSQNLTFDASPSINVDGTTSGIAYTWKMNGKSTTTTSFSKKFGELGCFPIELVVKSSKNGTTHSMKKYVDVRNLSPQVTSVTSSVDTKTKPESQKIIVNVTANGARDEDGVIVSYLWYYYTDSDPEPQNIKITQASRTTFVVPNISEKYYFGVILEDNDGAKTNSRDSIQNSVPLVVSNDDGNINMPLITLKTGNTTIQAGESVTFDVNAKTILGKDITTSSEYLWDFDGDGTIDKKGPESRATYTYQNAGTINMKVKVVYNGVSNTKYQTIYVKNELNPNVSVYRLGSSVFAINTSQGLIDKVKWTIGDFSSSHPHSITHDFGEDGLPASGKLEISDANGNTKDIEFPVASLSVKESSSGSLEIISVPEMQNDVITLKSKLDRLSLALFTNKATRYEIDEDTRIDSDLDGTPDNDADNKNDVSYTSGGPYTFTSLANSTTREKTAKVNLYDGNTLIDSKMINIILAYITDSNSSSGVTNLSTNTGSFSNFDRNIMDAFSTKIRALPAEDRAVIMQKYNLLIENWEDPNEKTKILFDIQEYVDASSLSDGEKKDISNTLNILLVGEEQASDDISVAIQVIKNLIPPTHPQYSTINEKLDLIKSHPTNLTANKKLGTEILEMIKNDETIEDKYKLMIRDQLKIIVSGGQQSVEVTEGSTGEGETGDGSGVGIIMGFISGFVKIFLIILGVIIFILLGGFLWYTFSNKKENLSFQDFIIDSIFHGGSKDRKAEVKPTSLPTSIIGSPQRPTPPYDPLKEVPSIDPLTQVTSVSPKETSSAEAPVITSAPVPDWLRASNASPPLPPTSEPLPVEAPVESNPQNSLSSNTDISMVEAPLDFENTEPKDESGGSENSMPDWLKPLPSPSTLGPNEVAPVGEEITPAHEELPLIDTPEAAPLLESPTPEIIEDRAHTKKPLSIGTPEAKKDSMVENASEKLPDWLMASITPDKAAEGEAIGEEKKVNVASKKTKKSNEVKTSDEKTDIAPPIAPSKDLPDWLK